MDVATPTADALAQPTRARVFALLGELHRAAATDELAERLGLHPNGVRLHLEQLQDAGLVERRRERIARGRPRDVWAISPDARPGGESPTGYAELAKWLVRSLTEGGADERDLEAAGREIGRELAAVPGGGGGAAGGGAAGGGAAGGGTAGGGAAGGGTAGGGAAGGRVTRAEGAGDGDGEQLLFDLMASLGLSPERVPQGADLLTYRLRNCPYRDAVRERPALVCGLHRGLTRGLLEVVDPAAELIGFEPRDPDLAGCLVDVQGAIAQQASAASA